MQKVWFWCVLAALAVFLESVDSARILAVLPTPSPSHYIWNRSLLLALAKKGHHLTVLSPDQEEKPVPNMKFILLEGSYSTAQEIYDFEEMVKDGPIKSVLLMLDWVNQSSHHQGLTKGAKELLSLPPDSFDLIIIETVFSEWTYLYLHHFGGGTRIPAVGLTAFGIGPWTDVLTGARTMPSVFTFPILPYLNRMNFWERLYNTAITDLYLLGMHYVTLPEQQKFAEKLYGQPLPPLLDIAANISVILVNNHYAINGPQAQLPGIIEVGCMQCSESKPLPKDIAEFLDGSDQGAIFFSLGSNLKSESLSKEKLDILISSFADLGPKIRVLWKFDPKTPIDNLPSNVLIRKWLPQEDVLGHPKLLLFITHGGLLSTQEAIYHGMPMIGMPFFADQHTNVKRMVELKVSEKASILTITKESFIKTILKVINDPSYLQNMQKLSKLLRDQPQTPIERAVFWTEYPLRHAQGRIESLRSAGVDLAWYQYFLLDVLVVILLCILMILAIIYVGIYSLYKIFKRIIYSKVSSKETKKRR